MIDSSIAKNKSSSTLSPASASIKLDSCAPTPVNEKTPITMPAEAVVAAIGAVFWNPLEIAKICSLDPTDFVDSCLSN